MRILGIAVAVVWFLCIRDHDWYCRGQAAICGAIVALAATLGIRFDELCEEENQHWWGDE